MSCRSAILLVAPVLAAADIHVAVGAAPGGDGRMSSPYATIAAGLAVAGPGDTVHLHAGTYAEGIAFPRSGTTGAPITLAAWSPDGTPERRERVVITTARPIIPGSGGAGSWEDLGGGLWRIALPAPLTDPANRGNLLVTLDGVPLRDARWPNGGRHPDLTTDHAARATAGGVLADDVGGVPSDDRGWYELPALAGAGFPDGALAAARVMLNPGKQWGPVVGRVEDNQAGHLTFLWPRNAAGIAGEGTLDPEERDWVVLWDDLAFLDQADEHWIDLDGRHGPAGRLYLRSGIHPSARHLAVGRGGVGSVADRAHIAMVGLAWIGGGLWSNATTSDILIDGIESRLAGAGMGAANGAIFVNGKRWRILDCDFRDSHAAAGAIVFGATGLTAEDVLIEDATMGNHRNVAIAGRSATSVAVRRATVWDTGSHGVGFLTFASSYSQMHVYRAGRLASDIATVNAFGSPGAPLRTRVHHNWIHSPVADRDRTGVRWEGCSGIRTDSGGNGVMGVAGVDIDHNLIWGEGFRSGIQIFTLRSGQTGWGQAAIRVVNNSFVSSGAVAGNIQLISSDSGSWNARGIEVANNLAGGFGQSSLVRDTAPPDLVAANLFTNDGAVTNLPVDNETRTAGRNLLRLDPLVADPVTRSFAPAAGSPLIDAGIAHPLSGPHLGSAPDIGAIERGAAPWIAGALVTRRHVPLLRMRGERGLDGQWWAVVDRLPEGRLLPLATVVRVGTQTLADGRWSYDAGIDRGSLRFPVAAGAIADGAAVAVDLDGAGPVPAIALGEPATGFSTGSAVAAWDAATGTMTITGPGITGSPTPLRPLRIDGPAGGDLRQRPVLFRIPSTDAARLTLVAVGGSATAPLDLSIDRAAGGAVQGWAVLPGSMGTAFGPGAAVALYATEGDDGGPRTHAAPGVSGAGAPGAPESVMWPSLAAPALLARFMPEDATAAHAAPVDALRERRGSGWATAAGARRPRLADGAMAGLPALRFDGAQGLEHPGFSGSAAVIALAAYRNHDPDADFQAGAAYQRLLSTGAPSDGVAMVVLGDAQGRAVPQPDPVVRTMQNNTPRSRRPLRLGADDRIGPTSQSLTGWLGESMLFLADFQGFVLRDARDYLATKYRTQAAGRLVDAQGPGIRAVSATFAGRLLVARSVAPGRIVLAPAPGQPTPDAWGGLVLDLGVGTAGPSIPVAVSGDTAPPARPAAPTVAPSGAARPTVSGLTEPFARVRVRIDGGIVATLDAGPGGAWSWRPAAPLAAGIRSVQADAADASGNRSAWSVATAHPVSAPPAITVPAAADPALVLP